MENEYAKKYRDLYQNHWWWRSRERAILAEIERLGFKPDGTNSILDVGCGDGLLFNELSPFGTVQGVETDSATLTESGPWQEQIFNQPFDTSFQPEKKYDLILMLDLLEHLADPHAALEHARSLLTPKGKLIMTVPAFNSLWTTHDDLNHHFTRYTKPTFDALANSSGVRLEKLQYLFHWTCPVKLAIRIKERLLKSRAESPQVPQRMINWICFALTRLEQLTISKISMPFGSSLLAIGSSSRKTQ